MYCKNLITTPLADTATIRACEAKLFLHHDSFFVMQQAAMALFQAILPRLKPKTCVHIVLGAGNNAGDGMLLASLLKQADKQVRCYRVFDKPYQGDAQKAAIALQQAAIPYLPLTDLPINADSMRDAIVVDALLGIGFKGRLTETASQAVLAINACRAHGAYVVAVDLPSGIVADTGHHGEDINEVDSNNRDESPPYVTADMTVTFIADKIGLATHIGKTAAGEIQQASLASEPINSDIFRYQFKPIAVTDSHANKSDFGHALLIGGGKGMFGAAALAAISAIKAGAGKSSLFSHPDYQTQYQAADFALYEVMRVADFSQLSTFSAIGLGMGLSRNDWGRSIFDDFFKHYQTLNQKIPLLLDADALYFLAQTAYTVDVITPHEAEAARLLGCTVNAIRHDKITAVKTLAKTFNCIAVLKGAGTLISNGKQVAINQTGNVNLASGGTGDVLAGLISGYLAQCKDVKDYFDAVCYAVFRHGKAVDDYLQAHQTKSLRASDLWRYF